MSDLVKVKPLEWHQSHINGWNDDWHTVPSGYTVRCADEYGWKWSTPFGAFGYSLTPSGAKWEAQADYTARILAALDLTGVEALQAEVERLREENASLAMFQCVPGYGDEYGNSRCAIQDDNASLRADLVVAREALRKLDVGEGWAAQIARAALKETTNGQ